MHSVHAMRDNMITSRGLFWEAMVDNYVPVDLYRKDISENGFPLTA